MDIQRQRNVFLTSHAAQEEHLHHERHAVHLKRDAGHLAQRAVMRASKCRSDRVTSFAARRARFSAPRARCSPTASTDPLSFGVASPVSEALGRANGTGHSSRNQAHKLVKRLDIGKWRARGSVAIAFGRAIGVSHHTG